MEGKLLLLAQRPADAVVILAEAASLADKGNRDQRGDILNHLGIAYDRAERYAEAIRCFQDAISDFREVGDVSREAQALGNLGSIFALKGQ